MNPDVQLLASAFVELRNRYMDWEKKLQARAIKEQAEKRAENISLASEVLMTCSDHMTEGSMALQVPKEVADILEEAGVRVKFDFSNGDKEHIVICWDVVLMEDAKDFQPEDLEEMC
jgi:NAD/NADP transhydrogenase beta subunit